MPCSDGGPTQDSVDRERKRHDIQARLACAYCQFMEAARKPIPEWAREWWAEHQDADRVRLAIEQATERNRKLRMKAVAKLTPEERQALGL